MHTTTSTPRAERRRVLGFTLVELLVATGLSGIVLAGVMSSVLMINRSGYLLNNYIEMEQQARNALETFAVDARVTQDIQWHRDSDTAPLRGLTLIPPGATAGVRYDYNSVSGTLTRTDQAGKATTLVSGIESLTFTAYKYALDSSFLGTHTVIDPASTTTSALEEETKMVQISLSAIRSRSSLADTTNNVVSARYVLRNKIQTN